MKKFKLYGSSFVTGEKDISTKTNTIEAKDLEHAILEVESNGGWYIGEYDAFKVTYIQEAEDEEN